MSHGHAHGSDLKEPLVSKDVKQNNGLEQEVTQLKTATYVSLTLMFIEMAGGYLANSLAIITDALHLLSDVGGFVISVFTLNIMMNRPDEKHSFGFQQVGVLGALFSVTTIWFMAGGLFITGVQRLINPEPIDGKLMSIIATLGFVANVVMFSILGHDHGGAPCDHGHGGHEGHGGHGGHDGGHEEHGGRDGGQKEHFGHEEHGGHEGHGSHGGHGAHEEGGCSGHSHDGGREGHGGHNGDGGHKEHSGHEEHSGKGGHAVHGDVEAGGCSGHGGHDAHEAHGSHDDHGSGSSRSLAMQAALIHVIGDMVQSIGVMLAGIGIWLQPWDLGTMTIQVPSVNGTATEELTMSKWVYADPICTILFTILVIGTTIGTIRSIVNQILMSYPPGLDSRELKNSLQSVQGVIGVHDLHVWMVGQGTFLTAHVEVSEEEKQQNALNALVKLVQNKYKIGHATFQIEVRNKFDRNAEHLLLADMPCGDDHN